MSSTKSWKPSTCHSEPRKWTSASQKKRCSPLFRAQNSMPYIIGNDIPFEKIFPPSPNVIQSEATLQMVAETTLRIESWPQTIQEFDRLIEATQDELVHFAFYRLGNREDAEDVVQDIYVQAFRDREKRRNITDVRPYLFRMTANRCTDFLRARSRRPKEEGVEVAVGDNLFDSL